MNLVDFLSSCPIFPGISFKNMTRIVLFFVPTEFSRCSLFSFLSSQNPSSVATTLLLKVSVLPLDTPRTKGHSSIFAVSRPKSLSLPFRTRATQASPMYTFVRAQEYPPPVLNDYVEGLQDQYFPTKYA